jgi:hypothetical protein
VLQGGQLSLAAFPNDGQYWGTQRTERRLLSSRLSERGRSMLAIIVLGAASRSWWECHASSVLPDQWNAQIVIGRYRSDPRHNQGAVLGNNLLVSNVNGKRGRRSSPI